MSLLSFLFGTKNDKVTVISAADFKQQIENKNVQLIDVRTAGEFKSGAIKNATNIDYLSGNFISKCDSLNKDKPVYLYCRSGARSARAAKKLSRAGFSKIYDLKGGISSYK
ncbi:rhodanese-like domain-containing protein [Aestuariibaculum sediminum]|uniref:Rhodanese-like domain-containing protein n=1 Tax=Aestuariibaculum sediminum TaxID=2770637 RepID=A0A8J6QBX9_9FLAO|nr:rhodanese-like domain-containing protein [Aestuariibaculum sediminum]MBD0833226.1 rhodanese-like domain-containing protein [Aestuariibaculum sediminum]